MTLLDKILINLIPDIRCTTLKININEEIKKDDTVKIEMDGLNNNWNVEKIKHNKEKMQSTIWLKECA